MHPHQIPPPRGGCAGERNAAASGILAGEPQFDWNKIQENRVNVVSQMVKGVESLVKSNKITVVEGAGSFVDGKTVKVTAADGTEQILTADRIIIAAGSHSSLPRGIMAEHASDPACMDSTGALELTEVRYPEKAFTNPAAIRWYKPDEEEGD